MVHYLDLYPRVLPNNLLSICVVYSQNEIHHYETIKIGQFAAGLHVDETFYTSQHKVNIDGVISIKNGAEICGPVTVAEHYFRENEKKREIYLLKPAYFQSFVDDFRKKNLYKKDDNYINQQLKKTGWLFRAKNCPKFFSSFIEFNHPIPSR